MIGLKKEFREESLISNVMNGDPKITLRRLSNGESILDTSCLNVGDVIDVDPENMDVFEELRLDGRFYPYGIVRFGVKAKDDAIESYVFKVVEVDEL